MQGLGTISAKGEGDYFVVDFDRLSKKQQIALDQCKRAHPRNFGYRPYRKGKNRCEFCGIKKELG